MAGMAVLLSSGTVSLRCCSLQFRDNNKHYPHDGHRHGHWTDHWKALQNNRGMTIEPVEFI